MAYAGFTNKTKDRLDIIINALNSNELENTNYIFNVIGCTYEDFEKEYGFNFSNSKIRFLGKLTHTDTLNILNDCHYSIFLRNPSKKNNAGFPTKFAESFSSGVPVITNETSDLKLYLHHGKNGFFVENDKEKLISELKSILKLNKEQYQEIKKAVIDSNFFNIENYVDKFVEFNKIIGI